jgi:hypothetical protein
LVYQVCLEDEIDNNFTPLTTGIVSKSSVPFVKLSVNILIHALPIALLHKRTEKVDILERVKLSSLLMPSDLAQHGIGQKVVPFLGSE